MRCLLMKKLNNYAIYDENELPIAVGTAKELAKFLDVSVATFWTYLHKNNLKKIKIFKIEDEEDN